MKLVLAFVLAAFTVFAYSQPVVKAGIGRFQIVPANTTASGGNALHAVFRLNTETGAVSYCFPTGDAKTSTSAEGVRCVGEK